VGECARGGDRLLRIAALLGRDQYCEVRACREHPLFLYRRESRHRARGSRRIQKGGDALLAHRLERRHGRLAVLGRRWRRNDRNHLLERGVLEDSRRSTRGIAVDPTAEGIRRRDGDLRQLQATRIDESRVAK